MPRNTSESELSQTRYRAIVEIYDGKPKIFPIAETDEQARAVLDAFQLAARIGDFSDLANEW